MPSMDELINSEALDAKIDDRARKVFFKSVANIKLVANPLAVLILLLVGFIFMELNTNVKMQNALLITFSGEFKEVQSQTKLNTQAIIRLVDQQIASEHREGQ